MPRKEHSMTVYDEFPTTNLITTLDPSARRAQGAAPESDTGGGLARYYVEGVGFNMSADWDQLRTPDEMVPGWTPPPVKQEPRRLQFGPWVWAPMFATRPYLVDGIPPSSHPFYWYRATAQRWLDVNGRWLVDTYDFPHDSYALDRVANAIADIERDKARAAGANVT
jgi:hypothetical protein